MKIPKIGDILYHNQKGKIKVLGITPHCGDYSVIYAGGWVYLKNCKTDRIKTEK